MSKCYCGRHAAVTVRCPVCPWRKSLCDYHADKRQNPGGSKSLAGHMNLHSDKAQANKQRRQPVDLRAVLIRLIAAGDDVDMWSGDDPDEAADFERAMCRLRVALDEARESVREPGR